MGRDLGSVIRAYRGKTSSLGHDTSLTFLALEAQQIFVKRYWTREAKKKKKT